VGYLQSVTDKIDIDLVTVTAYDVAGSQVLVPQRIEPGRRMRELSDAQVTARQASDVYPGSAEFRSVIAALPPARRPTLTRLADWAETLERDGLVRLFTVRGNSGTALLPHLRDEEAGWWPSPAVKVPTTCSSTAACSSVAPRTLSPPSKPRSDPS